MSSVIGTSLSSAVFDRWQLLVDVGFLVAFCSIHTLAWQSPSAEDTKAYREQAQTGVRAAATGGITVAGILIPLSILTVTIAAGGKMELPASVLVDFFVANVWFLLSLLFGLYVLYVAGLQGYESNLLAHRDVGIVYGFQLLLLATGVLRLVWGMSGLVERLI